MGKKQAGGEGKMIGNHAGNGSRRANSQIKNAKYPDGLSVLLNTVKSQNAARKLQRADR
jgi:hypothetical protein